VTLRLLFAFALVLFTLVWALLLRFWQQEILAAVQASIGTIQHLGLAGWLSFGAFEAMVAALGFLPASLLGIAAGAIYGVWGGFLVAGTSTMLGALIAFKLSRTLFRRSVIKFIARRPRLARFDTLIARDGWRSVCLIRLSPVIPFSATTLIFGLSSISASDFAIGTTAALPALFGYVCLGGLADAGLEALRHGGGPLRLAMLTLGIAAIVLAILRMGRMAATLGMPRTEG
jgi:uncharacterized membrane protein YdjX (TVP38/TMEM64 family)